MGWRRTPIMQGISDDGRFPGEGPPAAQRGGAGGGRGVFRPGGARGVRGARVRGQPGQPGRRRPAGVEVVLHQPRRVHGPGTGGGRSGRVRLLQPEGCRAGGSAGWQIASREAILAARERGATEMLQRVSAISPRASAGSPTCCAAPQPRLRGQAARSSGDCARSAFPATRWVSCGGPRTCCGSTAATATSSPGRSAALTRWRCCC